MARFSQEAKQINGLSGPTNMQIGSTHSWPDNFKYCVYFESLTSQAGVISHGEKGNLRGHSGNGFSFVKGEDEHH